MATVRHPFQHHRRTQGGDGCGSTKGGHVRTEWCGIYKKARAYLRRNGISYTEYDVAKIRKRQPRLPSYERGGGADLSGGGQRLNDFSEASFERLLDTGNQ